MVASPTLGRVVLPGRPVSAKHRLALVAGRLPDSHLDGVSNTTNVSTAG